MQHDVRTFFLYLKAAAFDQTASGLGFGSHCRCDVYANYFRNMCFQVVFLKKNMEINKLKSYNFLDKVF